MTPGLKTRILKVADQIKVVNHFRELVEHMGKLSDSWTSSAALMKKGLETRDVDMLSKAILENRMQAERMNYILQRYERIATKLGENSA
jgi:hypothetical protein